MADVLRNYTPADRSACLAVFDSNVPRYFSARERPEFAAFIDSAACPYFVIESDGRIAGCGGYGVRSPHEPADLCWGMIAAEQQGHRLGELLLLGRLKEIAEDASIEAVRLVTSHLTDGFFGKYGFRELGRKPEGIAEGLDEVSMRLDLTPATRRRIRQQWVALQRRSARPERRHRDG